ncbi:sulfotransferase family protein [Donghicola mangrovi]|uniref:Sulfotransferase domain-containing protein n=1 Tax=Donghicola mangrovi TaxID=2729614 RepID=A0A850Q8D3_9RHOB|nr:sulfotransferase [Donghicola mangrovi]NVO23000.1 sulfotransferase domain-containing protein [Donghicola mangrovi]
MFYENTGVKLPDFIIIGAMKSGTTTLYDYLSKHPDIVMSRKKETDFFVKEKNWKKGLDWYSNQFKAGGKILGEASPNYTKQRDFTGVPERIFGVCPRVRFIYILRDPVQRAISQYQHSFLQEKQKSNSADYWCEENYSHILDASRYGTQLLCYLKFFPLDRFLFIDFCDLIKNPQTTINLVTEHIGVDSLLVSQPINENSGDIISGIPREILSFSQSRPGQFFSDLLSHSTKSALKKTLSLSKKRIAPCIPDIIIQRMKVDLVEEAALVREYSCKSFSSWCI